MTEFVRLALLGGVLGLDATAVGQFMVSRPLVAGWIAGWMAGEPAMGITVGAILELFLLVSVPSGGARYPEGSTAAVVGVGVASSLDGPGAVALGVTLGLVWGQVGGWSVTMQRRVNGRLLRWRAFGGPESLGWSHALGITTDFLRGSAVTFSGMVLGRGALVLVDEHWPVSSAASTGVLYAGAAVSLGILLNDLGGLRRRRLMFVLCLTLGAAGASLL